MLSLTNSTKNSNLFRKELTLKWLIISLLGFCFLRSFKKFDLHNLIEAIEFKDESTDILSGLEAEIDSLIFLLILLLTISLCVYVCKFIPSFKKKTTLWPLFMDGV